MPSPPDVKPRQRLTPISKTCENAIVDRAKYGPFRRLDRKPMMKPAPIESTTPTSIPSQGPRPNRVTISAAE